MCIHTDATSATPQGTVAYKDAMPPEVLSASDHFSSLLSSNVRNSVWEYGLMTAITAFALLMPSVADVEGSMPLREFALFMWVTSTFRKLYNSYLEAVWFSCPGYRTQPPREHALKKMKDLCGREREQVETIDRHDFMTLLSQFALEVFFYYTFPGYYPAAQESYEPMWKRGSMLILNHYVLSFGMYWMHRALHENKWAWKNIHSFHHWARHPLSRNTYEDHWLDNFMNAIVGHFMAQMLVPLDHGMFWFSRLFRCAGYWACSRPVFFCMCACLCAANVHMSAA